MPQGSATSPRPARALIGGATATCGLALALALVVFTLGCGKDGPLAPRVAPLCTAADPGPAPLRRLTRFEMGNALADILHAEPALADRLPPDEISLGYDNSASAYSVSAAHAVKMLEISEAAADAFLAAPEAVSAIAGCDPLDAGVHGACLPAFVRALGGKLWRRALDEDEVAAMVALDAGESEAAAGVAAVVAALLQAPDFVYRPEPGPSATAPVALDGAAIATRLAYLITSAPPDDALLASAGAGTLATRAGLLAETDRLLAHPRALQSFQHFVRQWWELGELASVQKNTNIFQYITWTHRIPAAFARETDLFVANAWQEGPTLRRLLTAPTTFADAALAGFYGYPLPVAAGFQPISLDPTRASGLLTQGAFLATHAKPDQTSPILRGKFVRAQLFCAPPPPPPPDLVIIPPMVDARLSTRQRFQQHTSDASCAGCHNLMDPIGFAFEHFDAAGRWRDVDSGKPVDVAGALTGTDVDGPVQGVTALAARLIASPQVRTCVATQWFRWAFGRDQETSDDLCTIGALSAALGDADGDLRSLARVTVTTPTFLTIRRDQMP